MNLLHYGLNVLANLIIARYYNNTRCILVFSENEQVFRHQGPMPLVQLKIAKNKFDSNTVFNHYGCQGVVIQSENLSLVFGEFEKLIKLNMERFNQRRYLLLSSVKNLNVFNMVELNYVADLLLVVPDEDENFQLLIHKYVGTSGNNIPLVLDKWVTENQSFVHGSDLYPDKISNQQGRELRMATFPYEPYSVIGDSIPNYHGSELSTAVHFGLKYNMTPVPVVNELDYWGEIFSNWSGNGLLGNLVSDNADVGFSALYTWEICYHYLDLSKPLVRTGITCLVPAPKLSAGWLTPLLSYTPQLWICVGIFYGLGTLALSLIQYHYNRNFFIQNEAYHRKCKGSNFAKILGASAFKISRPFLLQPVMKHEMPLELNSKFMMILLLMFSLILTSTYSSGLSSIMTIPRYDNVIRSVDDFVKSGLSWGATQNAWITSIEEAEEPEYVKIVSRFVATSEEDLRDYSLSGKFGFAIERLPFNNFAIGRYIKKDVVGNFRLMQEDLYWEQSVMMLRKNSVLLPHLDAFILRAFEAGLISKWQSMAVQLSMDISVQQAVNTYSNYFSEHQVVKLKFTHIEGALAVLMIGWVVSFVVFLCELIKIKIKSADWL